MDPEQVKGQELVIRMLFEPFRGRCYSQSRTKSAGLGTPSPRLASETKLSRNPGELANLASLVVQD